MWKNVSLPLAVLTALIPVTLSIAEERKKLEEEERKKKEKEEREKRRSKRPTLGIYQPPSLVRHRQQREAEDTDSVQGKAGTINQIIN